MARQDRYVRNERYDKVRNNQAFSRMEVSEEWTARHHLHVRAYLALSSTSPSLRLMSRNLLSISNSFLRASQVVW